MRCRHNSAEGAGSLQSCWTLQFNVVPGRRRCSPELCRPAHSTPGAPHPGARIELRLTRGYSLELAHGALERSDARRAAAFNPGVAAVGRCGPQPRGARSRGSAHGALPPGAPPREPRSREPAPGCYEASSTELHALARGPAERHAAGARPRGRHIAGARPSRA
eukprot:3192324-Alexandrium_andersonii.AAC.1